MSLNMDSPALNLSVQEQFAQTGLEYLKFPRLVYQDLLKTDWTKTPYYLENKAEFEDLTRRYGPAISQGWMAPVWLRMVNETVGLGLFAGKDFQENDFLGEYTGDLQLSVDADPEEKWNGHYLSDFSWNYPDELPDGRELEITALKAGNELRFVNHSFSANVAVDHTVVDGYFRTFFRICKPVRAGEQLLVDYGEAYWSDGFRDLILL